MPNTIDYHAERTRLYIQRAREVIAGLPPILQGYFRSLETTTSALTRYAYAIDLRGFFEYLILRVPEFEQCTLPSFSIEELRQIRAEHIEQYISDISLYEKDSREFENNERSKARKIAAIRSMFRYFFKMQKLPSNVSSLVNTPKIHDHEIIRLEPNEVANLLDMAEAGEGLTKRQKEYHAATKVRDVAILTLFLGTGIRISELVGLDIENIDMENAAFVVTRKGGKEDILSFGDEVLSALSRYLVEREKVVALEGHERALFLSMQRRRITVRAVELLVKKYARVAAPLKKITPHKLRSTYGTMLYHETQDIYLVADVLGHRDVNTTRKHYAAASEEHKRIAAKKIRLRED